mmetsp:Transcript_10391/g.29352  ORF Transcript_10391/g.29352 Transcript_10391/m.29352 type:complete len:144 (+) Transcript_10391:166-597(+)
MDVVPPAPPLAPVFRGTGGTLAFAWSIVIFASLAASVVACCVAVAVYRCRPRSMAKSSWAASMQEHHAGFEIRVPQMLMMAPDTEAEHRVGMEDMARQVFCGVVAPRPGLCMASKDEASRTEGSSTYDDIESYSEISTLSIVL